MIGLTSPSRTAQVEATHVYTQVLRYEEIDRLAAVAPMGSAVLVDLAGRVELRDRARRASAGRTVRVLLVGASQGGDLRRTDGEEIFLAPDAMRSRARTYGAAELDRDRARAWLRHLGPARDAVVLLPLLDQDEIDAAYAEVLHGTDTLRHGPAQRASRPAPHRRRRAVVEGAPQPVLHSERTRSAAGPRWRWRCSRHAGLSGSSCSAVSCGAPDAHPSTAP